MSKVNPEPNTWKPAPSMMREWDEDNGGWLTSTSFLDYCLEVQLAVEKLGRCTIGAIRRRIVRQNFQGYLGDALSHLTSVGSLREVTMGSLTMYEVKEIPKPPKQRLWTGYNNSKVEKPIKPDGDQLYGAKSIF